MSEHCCATAPDRHGPSARRCLRLLAFTACACILGGLPPNAAGAAADPRGGADQLARTAVTTPPPSHRADPSLRTYVRRAGPFSVGPYGVIKRSDKAAPPPVGGAIVAMDARIVDAAGAEMPQQNVMLHHFLMTNGGGDGRRRDGTCPRRPVSERFYGTSEELRALTLPAGYGYPSRPRDRWKMIWMVMNHRAAPREIYLEYRVTVDRRPLTAVKPYWLSVISCVADQQYSVPGAGATVHRRENRLTLPAGGRVVAIGGHLHGGGLGLRVSQPRCGDRELTTSRPAYAPPGDPLYGVRPLLHEPDPKDMSWWQSAQGWPVRAGERLKVAALYDGTRPHMRVMGIAHVYVAAGGAGAAPCPAAPAGAEVLGAQFDGARLSPPAIGLTLARRGSDGLAREISRPAGRVRFAARRAGVAVQRYAFSPANLSIAAGAIVRWDFRDRDQHDVTVASAPRGFAGPYSRRGASYLRRLTVPGEYRLYCSLHPTLMSQYVRVRSR